MLKAVCLYAFPDLALEFLVAASTEHTETGDFPDSFFFCLKLASGPCGRLVEIA
jgi:hypothetical protein